jgi:hypothetical protein
MLTFDISNSGEACVIRTKQQWVKKRDAAGGKGSLVKG